MTRLIPIAAFLAALAAGGAWWMSQQNDGGAVQAQTVSDPEETTQDFGVTEMTLGDPSAPIEVIEYASFTCPHCATAHANLLPGLKKDYVETGKIRFTYREVYFDKYGMWGSLIARCGGADKFFGIVDLIYKGQDSWARAGSDAAIAEELRKIGRLAGIENEALDACLSDGAKLENLVAWYKANVTAHEIDATPSFVIDGQKYSNMSYADFAALLDEKLGE